MKTSYRREENTICRVSMLLLFMSLVWGQVDYQTEIQSIFNSNCTGCHGNSGGLTLTSYSELMEGGNHGDVVVPFEHDNSLLWEKVNTGSMPPNGTLEDSEVDLIALWIDEGALEELVPENIPGDINFDNLVNVLDVILTVTFVLGTAEPTDEQFTAGDLNEDGMINVMDVIMIVNIILRIDLFKITNSGIVEIQLSSHSVAIYSETEVAGIQMQTNISNIYPKFHNGWEFAEHAGKLLIYSLEGRTLSGKVDLFTTDQEVNISDVLVANRNGEPMDYKILRIPTEFALEQNYPNPFNPSTRIGYQLPLRTKLNLVVYDLLGQKIVTLIDGTIEAGYHKIQWDGQNTLGETVSSGVYFYCLSAPEFQNVMKMVLLR